MIWDLILESLKWKDFVNELGQRVLRISRVIAYNRTLV